MSDAVASTVSCQRDRETSNTARGTADMTSAREKYKRYSERHGGPYVNEYEKQLTQAAEGRSRH
jgi:hypothetical protein